MTISNTTSTKKGLFSGRKLWLILSGVAALLAAIVVLTVMSVATAKETYFVLADDIPARTLIEPQMLIEVETSRGTAPPRDLDISDITAAETYSLYALSAGDILTSSNTGDILSLNAGLPSDFVIASFTAEPSLAAGGNVKRGDYIDIIAVVDDGAVTGSETTASSYVLQRVLVVDATVDLDSYQSESESVSTDSQGNVSENTADPGMRAGVPTLFTVGLSPENAAILALSTQYKLFVVLSSADSINDGVVPGDIPAFSSSDIWGMPRNAGEGTDNTFGQGGNSVKKPTEGETNNEPSSPSTPSTPEVETEEEVTDTPIEEQ